MIPGRTERLRGFPYVGRYHYFLTICTAHRVPAFADRPTALSCCAQLLQSAEKNRFEVLAYCLMPDHLHALSAGASDDSDLRVFVVHFKKLTGYAYSRAVGRRLWQPGYYDHVLRPDEGIDTRIRYILENPVRAGLAERIGEYEFAWPQVLGI